MFRVLIFLIVLMFGCSEKINDSIIEYETDRTKTEIGFPVNLNISINNLDDYYSIEGMTWADSSSWIADSSKVIIKDTSLDTLAQSLAINFEITFWDTGKIIIPPYLININLPDSTDLAMFKTDSIEIDIKSVIDSSTVSIQKNKPIKEIIFPFNKYKYSLIVIIIFLLVFIYFLWKKRGNDSHLTKINFFNRDPQKDSVEKLSKLKFKDVPSYSFYNDLSHILKKYLENQFYIISFEMTSEELKNYFSDKDLIFLLERVDSVKFANKEFSDVEKKHDLELAKKIVRKLL
jgi:hypothetical protein